MNSENEFSFSIPEGGGSKTITINPGSSVIFVGSNGSGKTRLAVYIEDKITNAHRISAHRSLSLNPKVGKIPEDQAQAKLRFGEASPWDQNIITRFARRWGGKSAVHLLNDYDYLLQVLYAEQTNTALIAYHANKPGGKTDGEPLKITKMDKLKDIWERLLPHRQLQITGEDISVLPAIDGQQYDASEMSDGERAIFYMIGQVLVAAKNQMLVIDEPELHMHPSIMSKLWDELEAARPDCAFVYITHDLAFTADRNAQKFIIKDYSSEPNWTVEEIPESSGFPEELIMLILGSRRPILFIEGKDTSLDLAIYRACYPEWTVIPRSSCTEVIHSVVTMRKNAELTRLKCSGIVDGDGYSEAEIGKLNEMGVQVLPVSEIENMILLPRVVASITESEGYVDEDKDKKIKDLSDKIFTQLDCPEKIEEVVVRHCKRCIDRALKKIDLSEWKTRDELYSSYSSAIAKINILAIAEQRTTEIKDAIVTRNLPKLLEYYDDKGLLALAARRLKGQKCKDFKDWLVRSLQNDSCLPLKESLKAELPEIDEL